MDLFDTCKNPLWHLGIQPVVICSHNPSPVHQRDLVAVNETRVHGWKVAVLVGDGQQETSLNERIDYFPVAREKEPAAGVGVDEVGIACKGLRRVRGRINGDGNQHHVVHSCGQLLHLRELSAQSQALLRTAAEEEIHDHNFPFQIGFADNATATFDPLKVADLTVFTQRLSAIIAKVSKFHCRQHDKDTHNHESHKYALIERTGLWRGTFCRFRA